MDIGIDLGTANIIITMQNKGIVLDEPSIIAFNKKTSEVIAVGTEAYRMVGRTPDYIVVIRPLCDGVISDHKMAKNMITAFIQKVTGSQLLMPNIIMCIPSSITTVEGKAVIEAARNADAKKIFLIEEPVAALLGVGVDISRPDGNMVIDIGGGTTDVAIISMNGTVAKNSVKIAGNKFDFEIVKHITSKYRVLIGEKTAEAAKIAVANVYDPDGSKTVEIKGKNLVNGMPVKLTVSDIDIYEALKEPVENIISAVKNVFENAPPELIGDIYNNGIYLTGGGALLGGLDKILKEKLGVPCIVPDDPLRCVAIGTQKAFLYTDILLDGFENISHF